MVGEFPELQGIMGRYYAEQEKEDFFVAEAIRDHYKPQGPSDSVPHTPIAICIALADKLDTLISMFAIGEKPTGSKDPFALRRSAIGVIRIVLENNLRLPLKPFLNDELLTFFHDRLIVQLKDSNIRHDVIKAVIAGGDDDLVRIVARAKAVQDFLGTDDGKNLLAGYKRAANIVAIEEKKDKVSYSGEAMNLKEPIELELNKRIKSIWEHIVKTSSKEDFKDIMAVVSTLRAALDNFFDNILVNDENRALRESRLRLLTHIRDTMNNIADFSKIEG